MFANILLQVLSSKEIVIYGAGANGKYTLRYLQSHGISVVGFADKNLASKESKILGVPCKKIDEYNGADVRVIVTPYVDNLHILEELKQMGFQECVSWVEMEFLFKLLPLQEVDKECARRLQKNRKFKDAYIGHRCFIVGTGPSVKKQNLGVLKNEYVFTVNTGYKLQDFSKMHSNFHVLVDGMYFSTQTEHKEQIEFVEELKSIRKEVTFFFPYRKSIDFVRKYNLEEELNIAYLEEDMRSYWTKEDIDFTTLTPLTGTVVLTAVLLAIYMGFSEIYLLGCDCTDIFTSIGSKIQDASMVTYAWDNDANQQKRLENTLGKRSLESIYHVQYIKFKNFRHINDICNSLGIKLYDCTQAGLLDCVEKKKFEEIYFIEDN